MASKFLPTAKKVYRTYQRMQREQERQAKKAHAQYIRQQKTQQKQEAIRQKTLEKQIRENKRERERLDKLIQKAHIQIQKANFQASITRGKQALAQRIAERQKLKERLLNI